MRPGQLRARGRRWLRVALWLAAGALALLLWAAPAPGAPKYRSPRRHLPFRFWQHRDQEPQLYERSGCVVPPLALGVQFSSAFWQRAGGGGDSGALVFAAYRDARSAPPLVRVLMRTARVPAPMLCLLWYYEQGDPVAVNATVPAVAGVVTVATCAPPLRAHLAAVSLVSARFTCGVPRNILAIQGVPDGPDAEDSVEAGALDAKSEEAGADAGEPAMGACVLWWRRGDAAARLTEWLQLLRAFKVRRVYMYINHNAVACTSVSGVGVAVDLYNYEYEWEVWMKLPASPAPPAGVQAHDNVLRVVDHFSREDELGDTSLDVMPYASPPPAQPEHKPPPTTPPPARKRDTSADEIYDDDSAEPAAPTVQRDDMLPYNECIYRARADGLAWLALLDLDEIILPISDGSWGALAAREVADWKLTAPGWPDVFAFRRYWFPALLQNHPATSQPPSPQRGARGVSPAPKAVPAGRAFGYRWRAPTERVDGEVTGKMLRVASVVSVERHTVACRGAARCRLLAVDPKAARLHEYSGVCGGARRAVCRAMRPRAVLDDALKAWPGARRKTELALANLGLAAHVHDDADDL